MEILVSVSTRTGSLDSPIWNPSGRVGFEHKSATLIVHGPESVQDLRSTNCKNYIEPMIKWLSSITLEGSALSGPVYDEMLEHFAICLSDANTYGVIREWGPACVEMTMIFTNLPVHYGGMIYRLDSLRDLTKDITLPDAWSK